MEAVTRVTDLYCSYRKFNSIERYIVGRNNYLCGDPTVKILHAKQYKRDNFTCNTCMCRVLILYVVLYNFNQINTSTTKGYNTR